MRAAIPSQLQAEAQTHLLMGSDGSFGCGGGGGAGVLAFLPNSLRGDAVTSTGGGGGGASTLGACCASFKKAHV